MNANQKPGPSNIWACILVLSPLLAYVSLSAQPIPSPYASGQAPLYYHYFKERRPLNLDTKRVAVLQARTAAVAARGQALSRFGLEEKRALPIAGWSLAGTPATSHTEPATRDLLSRMSRDSAFEFVAPVLARDDGGIYNDCTSFGKATLTVKASTLGGNSARGGNGGGIRNNGGAGSASVELGSTILKAGASGGNIANVLGTVGSDGYNLASDNGGGFLTGTADQVNTDPMLGPLRDNGGPTFTHALLFGSPAIDKGANLGGYLPDQRGLPRTIDSPCIANASGGDGTDIGAFEVQQPCPLAVSRGNVGAVWNPFGFDIAGGSNQVAVVEASTNLVNWTALATNTLGASPLRFNDLAGTNFPQRFYRAKLAS